MNPPHWADLLLVNLGWGRDRAKTLGSLSESMGAPWRALEKAVEDACEWAERRAEEVLA